MGDVKIVTRIYEYGIRFPYE